ncbi:hypothetical protein A7P53_03845 [Acinetobacter defluvii]|uniref:hypothetical protein n=1 Tax=Acinetobacter defluvii TaxID=1871111 RepID=UPI001490245C|nr:hypothetical protein [Acinetobacter defluvii]NNP71581.1 hypothetical protein [Acinetobacter defluvii]
MKKVVFISLSLALCSNLALANENTPLTTQSSLCLFNGTPSVEFKTIKKIKVGTGTYESFTDLYPRLHEVADKYQANAVINYTVSQRFGFWPWRIVRPVGMGTMVKINTAFDCKALGGTAI